MENWTTLPKIGNSHSISDNGRLRREARLTVRTNGRPYKVSEKMLIPHADSKGYLFVRVRPEIGARKNIWIHRAVAEAFIRPIEPDEQVDHINGDKHDNRLENLQIIKAKDHSSLTLERIKAEAYQQGYEAAVADIETLV